MPRTSVTSHYANYYATQDEARRRDVDAVAKARNVIELWRAATKTDRPASVVEIGCGDGAILRALDRANFGSTFAGYEVSPSALDLAQRSAFRHPVAWSQFDGGALPLADQAYDVAILSHVVEHLEHPRAAIAEAARIARFVIVEVPLEHQARTPRHWRWQELGHINFFTPDTLRWLVESSIAPAHLTVLAERVTTVDRAAFVAQHGAAGGWLRWLVKAGLLAVVPPVARHYFTYHGALIATRAPGG